MTGCRHKWRGAAHFLLWECGKCGELTLVVPGHEEVAAMLRRIREDENGVEETRRLYAEAQTIIDGEKSMPRGKRIVVKGTLAPYRPSRS